MARPISGAVWLTRGALNSIKQKALLIEIDQDFLAQIQRILPASLAGFCIWTGLHEQDPWIKWHWYFDEELKQFVVPLHGIESNVVLLPKAGALVVADAAALSHADLARHVHRRIRRRHDWKPWLQLRELRRPVRPAALLPASPTLAPPPAPPPPKHKAIDGSTEEWCQEEIDIIRLLSQGSKRKQIASQLGLSTATVDRRLAQIRTRLNVSTNVAIVTAAAWHELI